MKEMPKAYREECSGCGYPTICQKIDYKNYPHLNKYTDDARDIWLCNVCQGTLIGNAAIFFDSPHYDRNILSTIGYCTNMILAAIKGDIVDG